MEKYFINPSKMDISEFVRIINSLHDKLKPNFNYDNPRMVKKNQISYKELLADEGLEKESQSIDKVLNKLVEYSQGIVKWNHPGTMININPPASIPSVAASSYFSLYNPNAAQDMSTGLLISTELAVSKMLCELVGWNPAHSGGIFTFGGKSTNLHSVKHGLL